MGLSEAAAATGVNRSTIYRAWKAGRLSATRTDSGQIEVEPAELFRAFPPVAVQEGTTDAAPYGAKADAISDNALRVSALEVEVNLLREMFDAMRDDRNAWREQAGKGDRVSSSAEPRARDRSAAPAVVAMALIWLTKIVVLALRRTEPTFGIPGAGAPLYARKNSADLPKTRSERAFYKRGGKFSHLFFRGR